MPPGLLERLAAGPVLGDGGYLLELERRGWVRAGSFTPEVSVVHPEALVELHREFLHAGAEVLQALTFYAGEDRLAAAGLAAEVDEINREAVRIARQVAREGDAMVAGTLSPTGAFAPDDRRSADHVRAAFQQQPDDLVGGPGRLADRVVCPGLQRPREPPCGPLANEALVQFVKARRAAVELEEIDRLSEKSGVGDHVGALARHQRDIA